jgi:hypothetical protein
MTRRLVQLALDSQADAADTLGMLLAKSRSQVRKR